MSKPIIVDKDYVEETEKYRQPAKIDGLIQASSENVAFFSEKMLGVRLFSWQVRVLKHITDPETLKRTFLVMTSRQIGKSTAVAILSIWACVFNKFPGGITNATAVGVISAQDVQAKKLLREIVKIMRIGDGFLRETYVDDEGKPLLGQNFFADLLSESDPNNTTTITFKSYNAGEHGEYLLKGSKSGCSIKSYPPTSAILGETFSLIIIDEAGKTDKITDEVYYEYITPTGNKMKALQVILSTPWTPSGFFYRLIDPDGLYSENSSVVTYVYTCDAVKIEDPEYHEVIMKEVGKLNADGKTGEAQRAYYCRFVKGDVNFFDPEKIHKVFNPELKMFTEYKGECDMGVDFGGSSTSKSVITISELNEKTNVIRRLYHRVYDVNEDKKMLTDIEELRKHFNVQRIIPDDCPEGHFLIDKMKNKGWEVYPMSFRKDKVSKYSAFRSKLNRQLLESYADDDTKTEMLALENNPKSKRTVIGAPRGYSDDRIDSWVMSCYFFLEESSGSSMVDVAAVLRNKRGR